MPCPDDSMKCVSTVNMTGYPAMDPIPFTGSLEDAMAAIDAVIDSYPRTKVTKRETDYASSVFKTKILRFKDTVEFEVDDNAKLIHFRSESVPYAGSDLGANRKRMTEVAEMLTAKLA
jgi:uncharacterized protein (DUF1499 family)